MDTDQAAISVFARNLQCAEATTESVESVFDGELGANLTPAESALAQRVGPLDVLLGGPPCQGHSDLNNHTRRRDPKNGLYLRMARAAEVLTPKFVVIENVAAVRWDEGEVVQRSIAALKEADYKVAGRVLNLARVGVPQRRKRYVLLATTVAGVTPDALLDVLDNYLGDGHEDRTVQWAIRDLLDVKGTTTFNTPSRATEQNRQRIRLLFETGRYNLPNIYRPQCHQNDEHSYTSVYGRLWWNRPAQTITTGFGCMGQGRYVHPQRRRTITPHEAARLQTFPDWFDFGIETRRGQLAKLIGNAVPPVLTIALGELIMPYLDGC